MSLESKITILLVHGGYVLQTVAGAEATKTEVFTSTAKLNKAVRAAVDELTLVPKSKKDEAEAE